MSAIGVIGAGAWGTALAQALASDGSEVLLWAREAELVAEINAARTNSLFLPSARLSESVRATGDIAELAALPVLLVVVPAQFLASVITGLPQGERDLVLCAKGIEAGTGRLMTEVAAAAAPGASLAVLSGPTFAHEVAAGMPTAVTLACSGREAQWARLSPAIARPALRPYYSDDLIGAEVGGAVKNVLAIACGVIEGLGLGQNARAALIARGYAEMLRFGRAKGARAETLAGLCGLGDLVLTCSSTSSRNFSLGKALGEGMSAAEALSGKNSVAEGAATAPVLADIARAANIDMPIVEAVHRLLAGEVSAAQVARDLLSRPLRAEQEPRRLTEARAADDIAAIARGGRTNFFGFFLRLAARIPFLFIAGRAPAYGPEALGRFASALVVIELTAMLCTLGEKRGLAQRLSDSDENPANVVADGMLVALLTSSAVALLLWLFPAPLFPGGKFSEVDRLMVLAIPPLALTEIWLAALAYRFDIGATVRARAVVEPWTISIMAGAMIFIAPASGLSIAYIVSIFASALTAIVPFLGSYGLPQGWRPQPSKLGRLTLRSLPIAGADAIEWGTRRIDILILGFFASPAAVGVYYVAQQVASLPQKLKTSFEPILGPVITGRLKERDYPAIARQVCQVGFWIIAAQAGIALALGIPGEGVMGLVGPQFVGGTGALALLLAAEVVAATAVVSEAALIYMARLRNVLVSIATITLQALLTVGGIMLVERLGLGELYRAAVAALALVLALAFASLVKARMLARRLGQPVNNWRWALVWAAAPAALTGWLATRFLPEWAELLFGIPAILGVYGWVIWNRGFGPEDRILFRKGTATLPSD